jgi:hypothetical protein
MNESYVFSKGKCNTSWDMLVTMRDTSSNCHYQIHYPSEMYVLKMRRVRILTLGVLLSIFMNHTLMFIIDYK